MALASSQCHMEVSFTGHSESITSKEKTSIDNHSKTTIVYLNDLYNDHHDQPSQATLQLTATESIMRNQPNEYYN